MPLVSQMVREIKPSVVLLQKLPIVDTEQSVIKNLSMVFCLFFHGFCGLTPVHQTHENRSFHASLWDPKSIISNTTHLSAGSRRFETIWVISI